jgi:phosphoheptose isomerase
MSLQDDHEEVFRGLSASLALSLDPAVSLLVGAIQRGGKIAVFGDLAKYMSLQFLNPQFHEPMPCFCLDGLPNYASFIQNGDGAVIFSPDDNEIWDTAVNESRRKGAMTLGLTRAKGMRSRPDVEIRVPSMNPQRVNEAHLFIIHALLEGCKTGIRSIHAA